MKILHILNSGNPGGVEQHVFDLVTGLIKRGEEVYVICNEGPIAIWYGEIGAHVYTKKIAIDIDPQYILSVAKIIRQNNIAIVHTHELKAGVNGILAAKIGGATKIYSHVHTPISEWVVHSEAKKVFTKAEIFLYSLVVNTFCNSEIALTDSKKRVKIREGIKANKIKVIPNGITISRFDISSEQKNEYKLEFFAKYKLPQNARIIGNVARLTPEKGQIYLIEAFEKVLQKYKGLEPLYLLIAGGGILELDLKNRAQILKIDTKIIFTGIFVTQDLPKIYAALDFLIFPSLAEGFGLVMLEAMASKLPIICSDLDILKEVGGPNVEYFPTADSASLAEIILHLLNTEKSHYPQIGQKLYERVVTHFGIDQFVENYIKLYRGEL